MNVEAKRIHNIKRAQECFDGRASTPRKLFRRSSREYATAAIWRQNRMAFSLPDLSVPSTQKFECALPF